MIHVVILLFMVALSTSCITTGGTIKSPHHPSKYEDNTNLTFPLEVAPGSTIKLTFTVFDLECSSDCSYDYVEVLDTDGSQLGKLCGDSLPSPVTSSGNRMTVRFISDDSVTRSGLPGS